MYIERVKNNVISENINYLIRELSCNDCRPIACYAPVSILANVLSDACESRTRHLTRVRDVLNPLTIVRGLRGAMSWFRRLKIIIVNVH